MTEPKKDFDREAEKQREQARQESLKDTARQAADEQNRLKEQENLRK
ncbi:hypothetical protein ACFQPF_07690 [Fictibacillus iocasae]|uniref:YfhD family protein n=1 Tax=Fictibacillus iocasae TaxID=2715437 RepID=A0ABW2NPE9_9BACL